MPSIQYPSLPQLYFENASVSLTAQTEEGDRIELPSEVVHRCLTSFADWGDLAKLACVQKEWSTIMYDAGNDKEAAWELAQALLDGTNGLASNPAQALDLLHQLTGVQRDGNAPISKDNESDNTYSSSEPTYFAPAMKKLAFCYLAGNGCSVDLTSGVSWMKTAYSVAHDIDAAFQLALIYEYGRYGVDIDVVAAAEWLAKAAEVGHIEAMAELGLCYELGCGVEQSDETAMEWYMRAAEKGHLAAKFSVAEAFEEARGVPQSDEEACLWYYKAAIEGDEDSREALKRLRDIARIVVRHLPGARALLED